MKTRKILSALLAVLVCATMAVCFTSCGDDDKKEDDTSATEPVGENTDDVTEPAGDETNEIDPNAVG